MDVSNAHATRNSEKDFVAQLSTYVDSGVGIVHVRANEVIRATITIRKAVIGEGGVYKEWDVVNGFRTFTEANFMDDSQKGDDVIDLGVAFMSPMEALRAQANQDKVVYFAFVNPHPFMEHNPMFSQLILAYAHMLPASNVCIILITPDAPLPEGINQQILSIHFASPGIAELRESLTSILESGNLKSDFGDGVNIDESQMTKICYVGAGMTRQQFEAFTSIAIVNAGRAGKTSLELDDLSAGINQGKTDVVNTSDILELYPPADISNVAGMENLKEWIAKRAGCYSDAAREFGIEPPKGIVLVGVPGTGKSLVAKAASKELGVPLVRLDFGRVFNSLVGASEQRMRSSLKMVESMAPCVLFADEVDKGLGGISGGSSGDSGVSMRVLGSFLTWLQDSKYPVFTILTANNIDGLPPELLRRGRFDAIFATGMPNEHERMEVLRIHLSIRGRKIKDFDKDSIRRVIEASANYVPAEIESAVKDGLIDAFSAGEDFTMEHVHSAIASMVPLSKAFKPQIERMAAWSEQNATSASLTDADRARMATVKINRVRNIVPRIRK